MKRYVRAALEGAERDEYIEKVKKEVERDLKGYVNSINWFMRDENVLVGVEFGNGSRKMFSFELWRFAMNNFYLDSDIYIIVSTVIDYMKDNDIEPADPEIGWDNGWAYLEKKSVMDSDGFWTDYTLWHNRAQDTYACFFGDSDIYTPENSDPDAEFDTYAEAKEWFENYKGFEEEDEIVEDDVLEEI